MAEFDTGALFRQHIARIRGETYRDPQFVRDVHACKNLRANYKKAWSRLSERREYTAEQKAARRLKKLQNLAKRCAKAQRQFRDARLDDPVVVDRLIAEEAIRRARTLEPPRAPPPPPPPVNRPAEVPPPPPPPVNRPAEVPLIDRLFPPPPVNWPEDDDRWMQLLAEAPPPPVQPDRWIQLRYPNIWRRYGHIWDNPGGPGFELFNIDAHERFLTRRAGLLYRLIRAYNDRLSPDNFPPNTFLPRWPRNN